MSGRTGLRIGIDLGGTKIAGVALDADGATRAKHRRPTPKGDYDGTVAAIAEVVGRLESDAGETASIACEALSSYSAAASCRTCPSGKTQVTVVPWPTAESSFTVPPCSSTKERTIERPSPAPRCSEPSG